MPTLLPIPLSLADAGGVIFAILLVVAAIVSIISANAQKRREQRELLGNRAGDRTRRTDIDERIDERRRERLETNERRQRRREIERELRHLRRSGQPAPPELLRELGVEIAPDQAPAPRRGTRAKRVKPDTPTSATAAAPQKIGPGVSATAIGTGNAVPSQQRRSSSVSAKRLRRVLRNRDSARSVIVATEVLGKPVALREA